MSPSKKIVVFLHIANDWFDFNLEYLTSFYTQQIYEDLKFPVNVFLFKNKFEKCYKMSMRARIFRDEQVFLHLASNFNVSTPSKCRTQ